MKERARPDDETAQPQPPAVKRRWGYFALPILYGDQLVGKLDTTADRKAGVLRVDAIHKDVAFNKTMTDAVDREIVATSTLGPASSSSRTSARKRSSFPLGPRPGRGFHSIDVARRELRLVIRQQVKPVPGDASEVVIERALAETQLDSQPFDPRTVIKPMSRRFARTG